jgi:CelD/BcsL family acetyltransferase involved in cellulose biosynthesis
MCPFINLSQHSWESYIATLGGEHRHNFRRRLRSLAKTFDVRFEYAVSEKERHEALASLVALHNMRWRGRGGSNALYTPALWSFHEELSRLALQRGWLRLFVLRLDGRAAASLYGFIYNRTFYFYQQGFDPRYAKRSLGLVMTGLTIEGAIKEGAEEYDFLRGEEEFKFLWARQKRELRRLDLYPPTMTGWLHKQALERNRAARRMARKLLPKTVADRITAVRDRGVLKGFGSGASLRQELPAPELDGRR